MERVGITRLANKDCNRMSGGELQMVLIARALINEPKLIILDEPETGLDFHNQILVLNMVERLAHESGISAIMNTHYPTNAMSGGRSPDAEPQRRIFSTVQLRRS